MERTFDNAGASASVDGVVLGVDDLHEASLGADALEEHYQLQTKEDCRIDAGTPYGTVAVPHGLPNERKVERHFETAVEVVLGTSSSRESSSKGAKSRILVLPIMVVHPPLRWGRGRIMLPTLAGLFQNAHPDLTGVFQHPGPFRYILLIPLYSLLVLRQTIGTTGGK